jgi:sugar/nucleoside kinase (ribokinase family)
LSIGVRPGSGGKTECIAYVGQDPFSTHMLRHMCNISKDNVIKA